MIELGNDIKRAIQILSQATKDDTAVRQTAVRWFNRLYYDLAQWNGEFVQFLKEFPESTGKLNKSKQAAYEQKFYLYARQLDLHDQFGSQESGIGICERLDFLTARLDIDFATLKHNDFHTFYELKCAVGRVRAAPGYYRDASSKIYETIRHLGYNLFGNRKEKVPSAKEARKAIESYIKESDRILNEISDEARKVGLLLLSVTEYDEALHRDGSLNPQLYVIGEVAMSQDSYNVDNRGGIFNVKSTLTRVTQAISSTETISNDDQQTFRDLIAELEIALAPIAECSPADSERIVTQVESAAKEIARPKPDGSFLKITAQGLEHAANAIKNIAPTVIGTTEKIINFLSKYY